MRTEYFSNDPPKPVLLVNKRGRVIIVKNELEAQKLRALGFKDPLYKEAKVGDYYSIYDEGANNKFKDYVLQSVDSIGREKAIVGDILEIIEI